MEFEIDGKKYKWNGEAWFDENFIKPPDIIIRRLDLIRRKQLASLASSSKKVNQKRDKIQKKVKRSYDRLGKEFNGLKDQDFQRGTKGTTWRRRTTLAGAIAQSLNDRTGVPFQSYAIYRRAQVIIAVPERFDEGDKFPYAKFDVRLNEENAQVSFYIERQAGAITDKWDWIRLMDALADESLQDTVMNVMRQDGLWWTIELREDDKKVRKIMITLDKSLRWQSDDYIADISWAEFHERIRQLPLNQWVDLRLGKTITKNDAIRMGIDFCTEVVNVFDRLILLYQKSTSR